MSTLDLGASGRIDPFISPQSASVNLTNICAIFNVPTRYSAAAVFDVPQSSWPGDPPRRNSRGP